MSESKQNQSVDRILPLKQQKREFISHFKRSAQKKDNLPNLAS